MQLEDLALQEPEFTGLGQIYMLRQDWACLNPEPGLAK